MTRIARWVLVLAAAALALSASAQTSKPAANAANKGGNEMSSTGVLPFGLREADLPRVEIMYAFYSAKTGAGKQELTVSGAGKVTLLMTRTMGDQPQVLQGSLHPQAVVALLEFMADQNFLGFSDHYPSQHPHARRVLRLVLPGQTKTVMLDEPGFPAFEMVAGAVKYAASLARPEVLHNRFFPNL